MPRNPDEKPANTPTAMSAARDTAGRRSVGTLDFLAARPRDHNRSERHQVKNKGPSQEDA
jgi:hypothetical protein